jgi:hypothetical protein
MEQGLYRLATAGEHILIAERANRGVLEYMSICNNHVSSPATIKLFLHDGTAGNDVSIVENLIIPSGVTLVINEGLSFNNSVLALKINIVGSGLPISIILK